MEYSFDIGVAQKYGVNEAIIFKHLCFWVQKNEANEKHFHEGRYWTYNTVKAFEKLFPFFTRHQINYAIDNLVKHGLILKGNFNETAYDRTVWYALTDAAISENSEMHLEKTGNGFTEIRKPIPDIKPDSKPNESESSNEDSSPVGDNQISKYEIYELLYGITDMKEGQKNKWRPAAAYVEKWLRQRRDQDRYPLARIKSVFEHIRDYHGSNGITGKVSVGYVEVALQKDVARWRMELEATAVMA